MPPLDGVGPILTLLGTAGGIWAVVFLFNRYQQDFTERYRKELKTERDLRTAADTKADTERRRRIRLELKLALARAVLAQHNLTDPTKDDDDG